MQVLHVSVFVQSDGNLAATVRVPSQQDAQYAISQLHRKKIGAKRILISHVNHNQPSPELKRFVCFYFDLFGVAHVIFAFDLKILKPSLSLLLKYHSKLLIYLN